MKVRELAAHINALMPKHGDCDVLTTSTDGSDYLAPVQNVWSEITGPNDERIVVLVVTTDAGDYAQDRCTLPVVESGPVEPAQYDVDDTPECPECQRGHGNSLGFLGKVLWFRCRQCGFEFNMQGV